MRNLNDIFKFNTSNKKDIELELAVESIMDGDSWPAYEHITELIFKEISQIPTEHKIPKKLYRFVNLKTLDKGTEKERKPVIEDLTKNSITLSNPNNFNDPMDPILKEWLSINRKTHEKMEKPCARDPRSPVPLTLAVQNSLTL